MGEPVRVALVDDDSGVLDSLRLYLDRQGLKTVCFAAAETLLAALDCGGRLDCIVSDVRMPDLSGLELVHCLNARSVVTPIILITAHGDVEMAVSAIKCGAFDFIEKPFEPMRLLVSIRNALEAGRPQGGRRRTDSKASVASQDAVGTATPGHGSCRVWAVEQGDRIAAKYQR
jgi:two-component system, LuxR family, response regulator FixJ